MILGTMFSCMDENIEAIQKVRDQRAVILSFLGLDETTQIAFTIYLNKTKESVLDNISRGDLYEEIYELTNFYSFNVSVGTKLKENQLKFLKIIKEVIAIEGNPLPINQAQLHSLIRVKYAPPEKYVVQQENDELSFDF